MNRQTYAPMRLERSFDGRSVMASRRRRMLLSDGGYHVVAVVHDSSQLGRLARHGARACDCAVAVGVGRRGRSRTAIWNAALVASRCFSIAELEYVALRRWRETGQVLLGMRLVLSPYVFATSRPGRCASGTRRSAALVILLAALELWQDWERKRSRHGSRAAVRAVREAVGNGLSWLQSIVMPVRVTGIHPKYQTSALLSAAQERTGGGVGLRQRKKRLGRRLRIQSSQS